MAVSLVGGDPGVPMSHTTPRGSATSAWPLHRAAPNRSQLRATAAPTISSARGSTNSRRQGASSTRSWPFYIESSAWNSSHARDNRHRVCRCKAKPVMGMESDARCRTFLYRARPARRTTTGVNAGRLQTSRVVVHLHRPHACRSPTTTDAPTEARMPMPTHRRSSDGRPKT
jgi:hypothetical protein